MHELSEIQHSNDMDTRVYAFTFSNYFIVVELRKNNEFFFPAIFNSQQRHIFGQRHYSRIMFLFFPKIGILTRTNTHVYVTIKIII